MISYLCLPIHSGRLGTLPEAETVPHRAIVTAEAVAIAFGLGVATIFTLGVVPVLYAVFYGVNPPPKEGAV